VDLGVHIRVDPAVHIRVDPAVHIRVDLKRIVMSSKKSCMIIVKHRGHGFARC